MFSCSRNMGPITRKSVMNWGWRQESLYPAYSATDTKGKMDIIDYHIFLVEK